jgi:dCMP deaminase
MNAWDELFMNMAYLVAMKSKDTNTHLGAVIVGPDNEVRSVGYNGYPRGIKYDSVERQERPEKYFWFEHAERNAIYNAAMVGIPLKGCRMYTMGTPCTDCMRACIQAGIVEVIVDKDWDDSNQDRWLEHAQKSRQMVIEAGIKWRQIDIKPVTITKYRRGKLIPKG